MDNEELIRAINYYKKKVEELAGENLKYDNIVSGLKHELIKNHKGFSLLSNLQRKFSKQIELKSIFEITLQSINETFSFNKSVILAFNSNENVYSPSQWQGFKSEEVENFQNLSLKIPEKFCNGEEMLLVTRETKFTSFIEEIQIAFNLPFFVCVPIVIENMPSTLLLCGRLKELRPFSPPLNKGDIDTLKAVADLITATIHNRHLILLKEADRLKTKFFTNISHEFRTPLTLILGPLEKLMEKSLNEEDQQNLNMIYKNAQKLLRLINQLLDLSKLDAGRLRLQAKKGNITSFVKGMAMSFESLAEQKDINFNIHSESNNILLYFDRDNMAKILSNLLSNAFKFTSEGGNVSILIEESSSTLDNKNSGNGYVLIKVKDTGIGIAEEEIPKLFDRFYQVDSSHTREHEGTGIGLALTKELVELHKGKINVRSKVRDSQNGCKGWTEFTIMLQMGKEHLSDDEIIDVVEDEKEYQMIINEDEYIVTTAEVEEDTSIDTCNDDTIILVVEDNVDMRAYIKNSLKAEFIIEEASNGEQGARKAINLVPDLIISDIMMPKMDGNELTRILKNDQRTSHIPIILLTAKSEQSSKLDGFRIGADAYFTKPFDTKELIVRVKNLIDIRKKLQEKFSSSEFISQQEKNEKKLSDIEERFMSKVMGVINTHLQDEEFNIEKFSKEIGMSRAQLYRKIKALSGKSTSNFVKSVRLNEAKRRLKERRGNISEVAYSVGFSSLQYFSKSFREEYGYPPSDLIN